jgi:hypothetical protein
LTDESTDTIVEIILNNNKLTSFNLECCKLGDDSITAILDALDKNKVITNLNLLRNNTNGDWFKLRLKYALRFNQALFVIQSKFHLMEEVKKMLIGVRFNFE